MTGQTSSERTRKDEGRWSEQLALRERISLNVWTTALNKGVLILPPRVVYFAPNSLVYPSSDGMYITSSDYTFRGDGLCITVFS